MNIPADLKYTKEHEWVKVDGNVATIGITDYAQGELGDIVFVELPDTGAQIEAGSTFGTIEAVKAVSDLFAPVNGSIVEINAALDEQPELVNQDPYGEGWMIKVTLENADLIKEMLSSEQYRDAIA